MNISRAEKILLILYKLSRESKAKIRFEDIAVSAFKTFPEDFQLKGYPEYPDTGDIIHKPLYSDLKKKGLVLSGNKYFSLTNKGLEKGKILNDILLGRHKFQKDQLKFTVAQRSEIENIISSTAYKLFIENKKEDILDIDFYNYLKVTVRTNKYDFLGRLQALEDAINILGLKNPSLANSIQSLHKFLLKKFDKNVQFFMQKKGGRG
jgi:hypothetical protein